MSQRYNNYKITAVSPCEKESELKAVLEQLVVKSYLRAETVEKELGKFCSNKGLECTVELYGDVDTVFDTHS